MTKESKEIATQTATEIVEQTGFMVGRGFERVDMQTVTMPRAKVMQPGSPELQDEDYNFKQGQLVHGLLMEVLPDKFIPVSIWDSKVMFVPRNDGAKKDFFDTLGIADTGGFIVCRSLDNKKGEVYGSCATCAHGKWTKMADGSEKPPLCTQTVNVLALFEGQSLPVVLQFSNTSYKFGTKFKAMALFSGGDLFSKKYKVAINKRSEGGNTWYELSVKPGGLPTPEELPVAEAMYKQFGNMLIDTEVEEADASSPATGQAPAEY